MSITTKIITDEIINKFKLYLYEEEKSSNTIDKYMRDVCRFKKWIDERNIEKSLVLEYKGKLCEEYAPRSVNSILSSLNALFEFLNWHELRVKTLKIHRQIFADENKELSKVEYERLLEAAKSQKNERLYYLMQTICSTGIRISENGKVNVDNINVIVNDEIGVIPNAYVKHNEDGTINVMLPDEKTISYANRITVTVLDSIGKAISDITVTVDDKEENIYKTNTDDNGSIVVPPLSEDMTDSEGKAVVNGYNVLITDVTKPIENAFVTIGEGQINIILPEDVLIDITNRITATITDSEDKPIKDMTVIFTDKSENTESNVTDENGKATVPPTNVDITDFNGYSEVNGFIVTVKNELEAVEKAHITYNAEVKNEDGTVNAAENISVILPENVKFDYANRVTITVAKKADNTAVKDMEVIVSELPKADAEPKVLKDKTNEKGMAVYPPLSTGDIIKQNNLFRHMAEKRRK